MFEERVSYGGEVCLASAPARERPPAPRIPAAIAVLLCAMGNVSLPAGDPLDDLTRWEDGRGRCSSSARLGSDGRPDPAANVDCDRIVEPGETVVVAETTTAEERRLPCIDRVVAWGADHRDAKHHGRGKTRRYHTGRYHDTEEVRVFEPESLEEGWFECELEVREKEPLRLIAILERSPHSGIYQASLDGVPLGDPIDLHRGERDVDDYQLMDFWPDPGTYRFRLECVGRNHLSDGWALGVNSIRLRERRPRVKEIGYLRDHDWRSGPVLIEKKTQPMR